MSEGVTTTVVFSEMVLVKDALTVTVAVSVVVGSGEGVTTTVPVAVRVVVGSTTVSEEFA